MGSKIAIIEDDPFIQEMYKTKLTLSGYNIVTADDGQQGLKLIEEEKPDLILLDLMMPVMSGLEVLQTLSKKGKLPKIIVLSNMGDPDTLAKARALGALDYIIKAELSPKEVEARVQTVLKA